jgi:Phytanoyl-CoA dioxygenase (PhyH)
MPKPFEPDIHLARTAVANWCNASRRAVALAFMLRRDEERALAEEGIAVIPDFLPADEFRKVADEARRAMAMAEESVPVRQRSEPGFGAQELHAWGFDRYDGGTLNRFVDIDPATMPATRAMANDARIARLCRVGLGMSRPPRRGMIYLTVHGNEASNHDIQKDLHRDSFSRKMKYWYFLEPVGTDDGPFVYAPGSHRLTAARLAWEREQAQRHGVPGLLVDGAYRISAAQLAGLGLPPPRAIEVAANTLVIADTFGFHRRGDARPGSRRLAIYGQKKPWPFTPVGA